MNFSFIIDTSISMSTYFDKGYNYLDASKSAIEFFIRSREMIKTKSKPDKYFLITTSTSSYGNSDLLNSTSSDKSNSFNNIFVPSNVVSSWTDPTDHLLFQLKILKIEYSLTNLENAIQTTFNLLNSVKKIGTDKHVHGRLLTKINNSFIILLTDGGKLNNFRRVLTRNSKIGINISNMINTFTNPNNLKSSDPTLFSDLYSDSFKWDQSLFTFILNEQADEEGVNMLRKYSTVIGGAVEIVKGFDDLITKIEIYALRKFIMNKVNINLEINNNIINLIQQNESKSSINTGNGKDSNSNANNKVPYAPSSISTNINLPTQMIKFTNKNTFNKTTISLNIDTKYFKASNTASSLSSSEIIFDRNESIVYKEKWPLPDESLVNKNMKTFPKRKSRPNYVIGNEVKLDFNIARSEYDEYEISDTGSEFLIKFSDNYPTMTLGKIKSIFSNGWKITWDVYVIFQDNTNTPSSTSTSSSTSNSTSASTTILKKPFAVIKLVGDVKKLINILTTQEEIPLTEFLKKEKEDFINLNINNNNLILLESCFKLKLCVLPYNFQEFFSITSSYANNLISESEFIIQIEKYMKKIPFYYKSYVVQYLERKYSWKIEDNFYKNLDDENLNENLLLSIKNILNEDKERFQEMNLSYNYNKQLHVNKNAKCCGMHIFNQEMKRVENKEIVKNFAKEKIDTQNQFEKFLTFCSDLNLNFKNKETNLLKNEKIGKNELSIEQMGNYSEYLISHGPLRNPYLFDNELKEFKGDYFGNPFRKYTDECDILSQNQIKNNEFNATNISKDGESLMTTKNEIQLNNNSKFKILAPPDDDELSVYPEDESKSTGTSNSNNSPICNDNNHFKFVLQQQLIDDDLVLEFKELFNQKDNERHGTKINYKMEVDMNIIYNWKLNEKLKEYSRKIIYIIKTNKKKEIISYIDDILSKPNLFFTETQKIKFLLKIKYLCEVFGEKVTIGMNMTKYINEKINNICKLN